MAKNSALPLILGAGALLLLMGGSKKSGGASRPDSLPPPPGPDPEDPPPPSDDPARCIPPKIRDAFGNCVCPEGYKEVNAKCMKVSVIPTCGPGETLQNGVCVPALAPPPGQQCPEGQVLVNGVCVDRIVTVPIPTAQEFVNQAQDKYLPAGYTMPTGVYDHGALWVSDDCRAWVMGRDWDMTNAGYDAGQFWFENDIEWIPMYPRGQVDFPEQATANYYGREIMFGIKEDCYPLIPDPENFADFSSYKAMRESLAVDDPGVYKLWRALSDIASSNMYQRLLQEKNGGNAPDQLLNRWGAQRVVMRWINGQHPNATLDDLANEAYWWAYPDCPQTLPSPAQARPGLERDCIERWNAILRIVNDLVNAWNLQSY